MNTPNASLIAALTELQEIADILGEVYREKAYRKAILELGKVKYKITPDALDRLKKDKVTGVGTGIFSKIQEFVTSGKIEELETLKQSKEIKAFRELSKIMGVGPATIKKWIKMKIYGIVDLRKAVANGTITLNNMQKWGLMYYQDLNERIPRAEVTELGHYVKGVLLQLDPNVIFEIAGSYRRGKPDSGDIDILISNRDHFDNELLENMVEALRDDPNFIDVISEGEERVTFLYKSLRGKVRQIDILNINYNSYYAALNYFTGGWQHNEMLRGIAKKQGYRLNQAGLFLYGKTAAHGRRKLELIPVNSEQEIYKILGIDYIPPHLRP